MGIVAVVLVLFYIIFVFYYTLNFKFIPSKKTVTESTSKNCFSIIISFYNEKKNLANLLASIDSVDYINSCVEWIFIDDFSVDDGAKIIEDWHGHKNNMRVFKNTVKGKKNAITVGIENAQFENIITLDADCIVSPNWLQSFNCCINEYSADMVCGAVSFYGGNGLLSTYQQFENCATQIIGAVLIDKKNAITCNGANLCYKKSAFIALGGFVGNVDILSGDDDFLLQKFKENNKRIIFNKNIEAIVSTQSENTIYKFIKQRIRWANKTKYVNKKSFFGQVIVGVFFILIVSSFYFINPILLLVIVGCKVIIDLFAMKTINAFYNMQIYWFWMPFVSMLQLAVVPLIGIISLFWNGGNWGRSEKYRNLR